VGSYEKNELGLHDMHGNVWEWCSDWYGKHSYRKSPRRDPQGPSRGCLRVIRGGGWIDFDGVCRSASRYRYAPDYRRHNLGFRVALIPSDAR
jgi:formylglycine-generating enzyme required for sulfatase activity